MVAEITKQIQGMNSKRVRTLAMDANAHVGVVRTAGARRMPERSERAHPIARTTCEEITAIGIEHPEYQDEAGELFV